MVAQLTSNRTLPTDATAAPPWTLVIFGASGDLTKRLLIPALYNLAREHVLDADFDILGVDFVQRNDEEFRSYLSGTLTNLCADRGSEFGATGLDDTARSWLGDRLHYLTGDLEDANTYRRIGEHLALRAK